MKNKYRLKNIVDRKKIIMYDFDGVIKDSNGAKLNGFVDLFPNINEVTKGKIREHHMDNLGMSRYDKIPYYMELASIKVTKEDIIYYQKRFSEIIILKVLTTNWIEGAYDFIKCHASTHEQYIVSATPKNELNELIEKLEIRSYIKKAFGSPTNKIDAIHEIMKSTKVKHSEVLFIGDGSIDFQAAQTVGIDFLLMQNNENHKMQEIVPLESQISSFC